MKWKREQEPAVEPAVADASVPDTFGWEGREVRFDLYGLDDVQSITVTIDEPTIPVEIGASFTCRIVAIERRVIER